jgi:drug/metabolite transporter (DMT)-like permease
LAAVCTTTFFIMGEHTQKGRDVYSTLFYTMLFSAVFWGILSPWWNTDLSKYSHAVNLGGSLAGVDVPGWLLMIWIGVAGSFLPMLFSYSAMRLVRPTVMGIISTSEVLFAFLFGFIWLGEQLGWLQTLGGIIVLAGIVIAQTSRGK